jgi:hypothetical protein
MRLAHSAAGTQSGPISALNAANQMNGFGSTEPCQASANSIDAGHDQPALSSPLERVNVIMPNIAAAARSATSSARP